MIEFLTTLLHGQYLFDWWFENDQHEKVTLEEKDDKEAIAEAVFSRGNVNKLPSGDGEYFFATLNYGPIERRLIMVIRTQGERLVIRRNTEGQLVCVEGTQGGKRLFENCKPS